MVYEKQQRLLKLLEEVFDDTDYDDEAEEAGEEVEDGPFMFGKDGVTKCQKHVLQKINTRTTPVNLLKQGIKSNIRNTRERVDIWQLFLTGNIINSILENTNKYIVKEKYNYSRERNCTPTNIQEI